MPSVYDCRIDSAMKRLGDYWSLALIHEMSTGPRRTLELLGAFKGLSSKTLADRLKHLEREGLIQRVAYGESPPRVEYSLTEMGLGVLPLLDSIKSFASRYYADSKEAEGAPACRACSVARSGGENTGASNGARYRPKTRTDVTLL